MPFARVSIEVNGVPMRENACSDMGNLRIPKEIVETPHPCHPWCVSGLASGVWEMGIKAEG